MEPSMPTYPRTIQNGSGEEITFLDHVRQPSGDYLEVENSVQPGAGPPMHVHYLQEEAMTVLSGRMGYQIRDEAPKYLEAGDTAVFAPGVAHRFWNAGDSVLQCRGRATPAYNLEYFLTALYASAKEQGNGRPNLQDAAFLVTRYKSEFGMVAIPEVVQRVLFPIQLWFGRRSGRFAKYADAPEPVPVKNA
jgi:quercetin dioxygenase-like cupin family protein